MNIIPAAYCLLRFPLHRRKWAELYSGVRAYSKTGVTPSSGYHALIRLHCKTNGYSNDLLHQLVRNRTPAVQLPEEVGVFGVTDQALADRTVSEIREKGFSVAPLKLPADVCDKLISFATTVPAIPRPTAQDDPKKTIYCADNPIAQSYYFEEEDLVNDPAVQQLMADHFLLSVAQSYLGCPPILDIAAMWWSIRSNQDFEIKSQLAQLYHFDMDRIKWLKIMIYLTDVDHEGGPHCFIEGTHRAGNQPAEIRKRGYTRIPDEDLHRHYPRGQFAEITGGKGSIIFVDTRGYHKGKPPISNDRLLLQFSFCNSLFGGVYPKTKLNNSLSRKLNRYIQDCPRIYSRFKIGS